MKAGAIGVARLLARVSAATRLRTVVSRGSSCIRSGVLPDGCGDGGRDGNGDGRTSCGAIGVMEGPRRSNFAWSGIDGASASAADDGAAHSSFDGCGVDGGGGDGGVDDRCCSNGGGGEDGGGIGGCFGVACGLRAFCGGVESALAGCCCGFVAGTNADRGLSGKPSRRRNCCQYS